MPLVLSFVGGLDGLQAKVVANMADVAKSTAYFSFDGLGNTVIMGFFLMLMPSFSYLQRLSVKCIVQEIKIQYALVHLLVV